MIRTLFVFAILISSFHAFCQEDHAGSGRAIEFDGVDDYIEMGNIYDNIALPITISLWIYLDPSVPSGALPILDSQNGSPTYNGFSLQVTNSPNLGITYGDGRGGNNPAFRASKAANVNSITGRWVHVTGVLRNHGDMDLYFNGRNVGGNYEGSTTSPMNSNSPAETMQVGYHFGNLGRRLFFQGKMDELRIWNKALTQNEIQKDMCRSLTGNEAGLIGYWNFDETTGNVVKDKSPNHFDGQLMGGAQRVYSGAAVGDQSAFLYPTSWTNTTLSLDNLTVQNIRNNPHGVHLYRVDSDPSQTGGLAGVTDKNPYYGIYLAEDPEGNLFDFKLGEGTPCPYFTRNNNGESSWAQATPNVNITSRIEIVPSGGESYDVDLGSDKILCDRATAQLTAQVTPNATGKTFLWNTGQITGDITISQSGEYIVQVTGDCGVEKDTVRVDFLSGPPDFSLGDDGVLCGNDTRVLKLKGLSGHSYNLLWQDGSHADSLTVTDAGLYWLRVENVCGSKTDSILFSHYKVNPETIPNIITPNGDVFNEYFVVDPVLEGSRLYVVNRYGKKVFESSSYKNDWNGHGLPSGIYFYRLSGICIGEIKGTIHLIR